MSTCKEELTRLTKAYPDIVRILKKAGYSLTVCQYPEGYSRFGKPLHTETVFQRIIEDVENPPSFPPMVVKAVICDTRDLPEIAQVSVVFSTEFWLGRTLNMYLEQVHASASISPEEVENAFRFCVNLARYNNRACFQVSDSFQKR
jgi:hypothetical protein